MMRHKSSSTYLGFSYSSLETGIAFA